MKRFLTYLWQHSLIALLGASMVMIGMPACTPQQKLAVVQDIQKFIPVVTNVADAVCAFTPAAPICATASAAAQASASVLVTALENYYTAEAKGSVPPGVISALSLAISTFESDAAKILDAVHVDNPQVQADIQGLAATASALLGVIETLFPTPAASAASLRFSASRPATAKAFSLNSWVVGYNSHVTRINHELPRNAKKLKAVHAHSLLLRALPGIH